MIEEKASSSRVFNLIQSWLSKCYFEHYLDCSPQVSKLPKRVIDVGDSDGQTEPRLCVPSEEFPEVKHERYVALSYCWGPLPFLTTTTSTIEKRRQCIPMIQLPATVRDAVRITRRLGIRYLWVDALCIVQGSDQEGTHDWQIESALMKEIYGGAFLTICATSAAKAQDGILVRRVQPTVSNVRIPYVLTSGHTMVGGSVFIGEPRMLERTQAGSEPLDARGWALQEKLLSHRILTYKSTEVTWQCQCAEWRESGEPGRSPNKLLEWYPTVEEYTKRDLTMETDRLLALAGIAQHYAHTSRKHYVMGMWRESLVRDVLWIHQGKVENDTWQYARPLNYHASSWSWASVKGGIRFLKPTGEASATLKIRNNGESTGMQADENLSQNFNEFVIQASGYLAMVSGIKCSPKATYDGIESESSPLHFLGNKLRTYLDSARALESLAVPSQNGQHKLLQDVWFLELYPDAGLVLQARLDTGANRTESSLRRSCGRLRLKLTGIHKTQTTFERIGVYSCNHRGDILQAKFKLHKDIMIF